jgi:hypothetical protein
VLGCAAFPSQPSFALPRGFDARLTRLTRSDAPDKIAAAVLITGHAQKLNLNHESSELGLYILHVGRKPTIDKVHKVLEIIPLERRKTLLR